MNAIADPPVPAVYPLAPPIQAAEWLNTSRPLSLAALRGRVVVLHFFQMLCPGCAARGVPQATEIQRSFDPARVAVVGVHSVFEHHDVMTPAALRVFAHEYRLTFPIAIDRPADDSAPIPLTMRAYGLQGTPSLVLIDAEGRVRAHHFGHVSDLKLGAEIGELLAEEAIRRAA
ncbi:MAG: redoxin domain-containing protein [Burkholderiales bacterium]|nr:redoxin domain-containing protein [Opitutaceae bacterium]